jgi:Mlc titration factor MtfA (ptsG expression regulator)
MDFIVFSFFLSGIILVVISKHRKERVIKSLVPNDRWLHEYLSQNFTYYNGLNTGEQSKFILRLVEILKYEIIHVDDTLKQNNKEITIMISAAYAQITFGFWFPRLVDFSKIIVYPDSFYSKLVGDYVNGLTIGRGYIYLSWSHFLEGYSNCFDKKNLALHELAHAVYIDRFHYHPPIKWLNWLAEGERVFELIRTTDSITFFRDYGKTNMAEFWAVCVECFFEDPTNFNFQFPLLYELTCEVLEQNPIKRNALFG